MFHHKWLMFRDSFLFESARHGSKVKSLWRKSPGQRASVPGSCPGRKMLGEGPGRAVAIWQRLRVYSLQAAQERQGRVLAESLREEQGHLPCIWTSWSPELSE